MKIFIHVEVESQSTGFLKLEWILHDDVEVVGAGVVHKDSPTYLLEFVHFLLAVGSAETMIGHNLDFKLKSIGKAMKHYHLSMSLERPTKLVHLDLENVLPDMNKPKTVNEVYENYINNPEKVALQKS